MTLHCVIFFEYKAARLAQHSSTAGPRRLHLHRLTSRYDVLSSFVLPSQWIPPLMKMLLLRVPMIVIAVVELLPFH